MKSKISLFNKAIFKRNLTGGWGLWVSILVIYLLALPINTYGTLLNIGKYNTNLGENYMMECAHSMVIRLWSMGFFVIFFAFVGLACAMFVFSYLFTGRNSNMMHTYPVSRIGLFVTNYVTGLLFLLAPMVLGALLMLAVGAAHGAVNGAVVRIFFIWIGTAAVENIFFFSMAVCMLMFVGNIIAIPVLYLILNFLYEGCLMIAGTMANAVCYGLSMSYTGLGFDLPVLTPISYLSKTGVEIYAIKGFDYPLYHMESLLGYFAVAILFTFIAIVTYQKKHIETAGDVITVNWLKPIFRWGVAVCTSGLGTLFFVDMLQTNSFFTILCIEAIIGILAFFITQMLLERSVHIFKKKRVRECVIYTAIVGICYFALDADVLGLEKKMPAADDIYSIQMYAGLDLYTEDAEEISWVQDIHRQIIASKKEFERKVNGSNTHPYYVNLEYTLKDNSTMRRVYEIPGDSSVAQQMEEYAKQPEVILRRIFSIHYPDIEVYGGTWRAYETAKPAEMQEMRISEANAGKLYEALLQDVQEGHLEEEEAQSYGSLTLYVRDEAGFVNVYSDWQSRSANRNISNKEGEAYIDVGSRLTCLIGEMHELGYLSDELYARMKK